MTTIKRFTPDYKMHAVRFEAFAREAEHGELVQFGDHQQVVSALKAERDALADRVERLSGMLTESRVATKSAEERADALAVENAALNKSLDDVCESYENGQSDLLSEAIDKAINLPSPATDAALAAIRNEATARALKNLCDCQLISATVAELKADELREAK